jgi:signal transduction histidine kinase
MENVVKLNEAFHSFTQASKSLESHYAKLSERVDYLTQELEEKNDQLNHAILEVRESKDYLQAVLQSISEAIIVLDQDEKISMINRASEELFSIVSERAAAMRLEDLNYHINDSLSGTKLTVNERTYDVILSRSTVLDPEGKIRGFVILIKDITRIKELERQQERNQRLIAMGEMAAKIVHEIRSPLCSIELFSNMLTDDLEGTAHSDMARGISTGIKSLNNILTNMLFFAKSQKPALKDIRLDLAIEDSIAMLTPLIEVRGVKIMRSLSKEVVSGDTELLKQVFMNILMNAVQAMPEGGEIEISMASNDEYVSAFIVDEGEGIRPENVEKIFDPFFSTKDTGTGLGLAIAHKIMQCHDGLIRACRNDDKGSTFNLSFPVRRNTEIIENEHLVCDGLEC